MIRKYIKTKNGMSEVQIYYTDESLAHSTEQIVVKLGTGDVQISFTGDGFLSFKPNQLDVPIGEIVETYEEYTPPVVIKFGDVQSVTNLINALLRMGREMSKE